MIHNPPAALPRLVCYITQQLVPSTSAVDSHRLFAKALLQAIKEALEGREARLVALEDELQREGQRLPNMTHPGAWVASLQRRRQGWPHPQQMQRLVLLEGLGSSRGWTRGCAFLLGGAVPALLPCIHGTTAIP